ncbi:SusC/RagA family TonB-linked outer membrane protein [Sphingobacterium lactis]|uniref:SusC/RagA family TonB-linked outer membrane protein n=1 Tax=Sphingobacterium lactis TaxID=797291 RepID=UPI003EC7697F
MRQKLLSLIFVLNCLVLTAFAQDRQVSGRVTSSSDGAPLSGVSVAVVGTSVATQTDGDGGYSLAVPENATLNFSYVGYDSQRIPVGTQTTINVALVANSESLEEVVVTALGVQRTRKSLGYSVQQVKGDDLTQAKQVDLNTALAGKVSGVQIRSGSGAKFGTSSLRIRGVNNLTGGNPIYVVDGVITSPELVNNDDVENLTVLKGPAATALYGQRGSEGAVVITTRRGKVSDGIGVDVNQATSFENVFGLPKYQNEYGGGYNKTWQIFEYDPTRHPEYLKQMDGVKYYNYGADESWGPRMDGTMHAPWYSWDPTHPKFGQLAPFDPQPDNVKNFFETGSTLNTNVAISKAADNYNTRVSYTNLSRHGVMPNTKQNKHFLGASAGVDLSDKLTVSTNLNFIYEDRFNTPIDGYSSGPQSSFNQWFARNINMDDLRDYQRPDGTYRSWNMTSPTNSNPAYWNNPFVEMYKNIRGNLDRTFYGNVTASYKFNEEWKATAVARGNFAGSDQHARIASRTLSVAEYYQYQRAQQETNFVGSIDYTKQLEDFNISAAIYGETRNNKIRYTEGRTQGGLAVPDLYTLSASKNRPLTNSYVSDYKVNSLFGYVTLGYRDFLFVEGNLRNDWSSSLPDGQNSYLYGGVSGSFIFTEFLKADWLSYGKVRASFAKVGTDTDPYRVMQTYLLNSPYGSNPLLTVPNQIPNAALKPTLSTSIEVGTELRFLNDRLTFDYNYYTRSAKDQIIPMTITGATGYSTQLINAGQIDNWGHEFSLGGTPVRNDNLTWTMSANIGINRNEVVELYEDPETGMRVSNLRVTVDGTQSNFGFVGAPIISLNAREGETFGMLTGSGYTRNEKGEKVVGADGYYIPSASDVDLGTILPDFTGGFTTNVNYKGFNAGFSLDFQKGGKYMSISSMFGSGSGLFEETAGLNDKGNPKRDPVEDGGGVVLEGVKEDGTPNDIYVDVQELYRDKLNTGTIWEHWVYDASYVKLREVSIGYTFPDRIFGKTPFKKVSLNLIAQNPWLIYAKNKNFDPSILEGSWFEGGQLPNVRSFGFNLRFSL